MGFLRWLVLFLAFFSGIAARPLTTSTPTSRTIFMGDSIFDVGNNNHLEGSISRCDFSPYGISRFKQPSGRCSNGYLIPDLVNKTLDIPLSQPYLGGQEGGDEKKASRTLNLASDGSGLLDGTHSDWGVVSFNKQLQELEMISKDDHARVADMIVFVSSGGNDIAANLQGSIDFSKMLETLRSGIERIYNLGYRKIVYSSVGPLGCAPVIVGSGSTCSVEVNVLAAGFNKQVEDMLVEEEQKLAGLKVSFLDSYSHMMKYISHPAEFGFKSATAACCPNCLSHQNTEDGLCDNPNDHVFWDGIHPTEHTYQLLTKELSKQIKSM